MLLATVRCPNPDHKDNDMKRLLLVYPTLMRKVDSEVEIETDFCECLRLYLDNFDRVTLACPITRGISDMRLERCRRVQDLPWRNRLRVIPLPHAYSLVKQLQHYSAAKKILRVEIENADYLLFHPHTLIGDWPTIAVCEAIKLRRRYAIDADVVYDRVGEMS